MFMVIHRSRSLVVYNELASEILQCSADIWSSGDWKRDEHKARTLYGIAVDLEHGRIDEREARHLSLVCRHDMREVAA